MGDESPYQEPEDELVSDTRQLYRTGALVMPALADVYRDLGATVPAEEAEYPFRRTGGVGRGETGPYPELVAVLDYLGVCLDKAERSVQRSGEALCYVADLFAHTDAAAGRSFDEIAERLDEQAAREGVRLESNSLDNQIEVVDTDDIPDAPELTQEEDS